MKVKVRVLRPFKVGKKLYNKIGKEVQLPAETVDKLLKINVNMVQVIGEEPAPEPTPEPTGSTEE